MNEIQKRHAIWTYELSGPHALLTSSGKHADGYFNSNVISQEPAFLREICTKHFTPNLKQRGINPDWIVTYAPYGIPFAYELASQLGCQFGYLSSISAPKLNFLIRSSAKILPVADDIFSGDSMKIMTTYLASLGYSLEPLRVCIGNLSGSTLIDDVEVLSLFDTKINLWSPEECPLCKSGSPVLGVRELWTQHALCSS